MHCVLRYEDRAEIFVPSLLNLHFPIIGYAHHDIDDPRWTVEVCNDTN